MSEVAYQLTTEDVRQFIEDKENMQTVLKRIQKDFSCMEELGYFVQSVEEQLNVENGR